MLKEPCLQRMRREEKVLGKGSMATGCELSKEKGWWQGDMMEARKKMRMAMRSGSVMTWQWDNVTVPVRLRISGPVTLCKLWFTKCNSCLYALRPPLHKWKAGSVIKLSRLTNRILQFIGNSSKLEFHSYNSTSWSGIARRPDGGRSESTEGVELGSPNDQWGIRGTTGASWGRLVTSSRQNSPRTHCYVFYLLTVVWQHMRLARQYIHLSEKTSKHLENHPLVLSSN